MRALDPHDPAATYAAVLDALPIVAFMADPDGEITYLSGGWERFTGNDAATVLRAGYAQTIHPDDLQRAGARWDAAREAEGSYRDEFRIRFGDGTYRWVLARADPMRAHGSNIIGWFGTLTDIDDFKRTEAALAESEATHRAISAAIPGVTWAASPQGELTFVGERWISLHGKPRDGALGESWLESVYPGDRERVLARWAESLSSGDPYDTQFRLRVADGTYRWFLVRALPVHDDAGAIVRWMGVNVDIDDQHRADDAREKFVRLVEASDDFIGIADAHGNATYVNEAGRRMLDIGSPEEALATNLLGYFSPQDRAFVESDILPAIEREGRWTGEFWLRNFRTGERIPISYNLFALHDTAGERAGIATVSRDLRERRRVEAGLLTLAETGAAMFSSLDYEQTVRNVALAATRGFASYCIVDTLDAGGRVRHIAAIHADPAFADLIERIASARGLKANHPVARALRDGVSSLVPSMGENWMRDTGMDPSAADDMRALGPRSIICVPVRTGGDGAVIGAMSFVVDARDPRGPYTTDDLRFAEEIALRAGLAFDHAHAYERERRIAEALQAASLPRLLPAIDRLVFSADYRSGSSEATIGGDWYDAFALRDDLVAVTIGDVLGSGLDAAVTMSKVRQAMRSASVILPDPNAMLEVADRTVRDESSNAYATALAGVFDPMRRSFRFASAGHLGPVVRYPDGRVEEFACPGIMLGLRERSDAATVAIPLVPESMLVFYTDGLVEATRDIEEGRRRLHAAIRDRDVRAAENPARALVDYVLGDRPASDDIAVLVAIVPPPARPES